MNEHANALPVGYRLGEYEIQTVLGSGGFGITYRARDRNLGKLVAIKEYLPSDFAVRDGRVTVKPKSAASKDDYVWGLGRFADEARALARFDHPHINKVHRFFKDNGTAYLVLEYIEGDMLSDLLRDKGHFNEAGIRRMLDELLDGLAAVHKAGYVHRDIKPANIIFRRDGSAVLLDFGAARQAIGRRTQTVTAVLTVGYAPAEQYVGVADVIGPWTDLYSLGVVSYRCLVGGDESVLVDALVRAHYAKRGEMDKDMPLAVKVGKDKYSDGLLKAIDWAMQVEEIKRPQSVAELRAALADRAAKHVSAPVAFNLRDALAKSVRLAVDWNKNRIAENARIAAATRVAEEKRIAQEKHKSELAKEQAKFRQLVGRDASPSGIDADSDTTDLHIAAANGWAGLTQWLIDNGADVNARLKTKSSRDALSEAFADVEARRKAGEQITSEAVSEALKERLRLMYYHGVRGERPIHCAAQGNAVEVTKLLLASGADVNAGDKIDWTPLHHAAWKDSVDVANLLLANGANVNAKDGSDSTPLHMLTADSQPNFQFIKLLLVNGVDVNSKDNGDKTPLHGVATRNSPNLVKLLLDYGADVHAKDSKGWTPLHHAAFHNPVDVVKSLLANGADVHAKDNLGETPLHAVSYANAVESAKLLFANGADVNAISNDGHSPLHKAASYNAVNVAKMLLANGADGHLKDKRGYTPLHEAARGNSVNVTELLLASGTDVHAQDNRGYTPLHEAAWFNAGDVAKVLLANGADVNAEDNRGETPLHEAAWCNAGDVAKVLLANGAHVNAENNNGWLPLDWAKKKGHQEIIALFEAEAKAARIKNSNAHSQESSPLLLSWLGVMHRRTELTRIPTLRICILRRRMGGQSWRKGSWIMAQTCMLKSNPMAKRWGAPQGNVCV